MEGENPTRRYKWFRPRQAARAFKATGVPTNNATVSLFNNSTGRDVLVVRDIRVAGTASDAVRTSYQSGQIGSSQGLVAPLTYAGAVMAGLLASIDTATLYAGDNSLDLGTTGAFYWYHDFPFAVIMPGISLVLQDPTVAHALSVSIIYESILEEELDFWY